MSITISKLECFKMVADLESVSKAADKLQIAQSSLSRTIASLESDLGYYLFDHVGRNVELNKYGEIVKNYSEKVLLNLDAMVRELHDTEADEKRTVTLAVNSGSTLLPQLLSGYAKINPDIKFNILLDQDENDQHKKKKIDLSIISSLTPLDNDYCVTLLKENLLLGMPKSDPLSKKTKIRLEDLKGKSFLSLQQGKDLRSIADYYCRLERFIPNIVIESDSPQTIRDFINAGMGVAFVPEYTWGDFLGDNIVKKKINAPTCVRYICLAWSKSGYLSAPATAFKTYLIDYFKNINNNACQEITDKPL